jgi:carbamate kinase
VEAATIEQLVSSGTTVICSGGGGCPVVERDGRLVGIEAVVDKDRVAAQLAIDLEAELLLLVTDVAGVYAGFGTPGAELLGSVTPDELDELTLAAGSMGPKAEAAGHFVRATGHGAVIGALDELPDLLRGQAGTRVVPAGGRRGARTGWRPASVPR